MAREKVLCSLKSEQPPSEPATEVIGDSQISIPRCRGIPALDEIGQKPLQQRLLWIAGNPPTNTSKKQFVRHEVFLSATKASERHQDYVK
jgi:hypothetical protein